MKIKSLQFFALVEGSFPLDYICIMRFDQFVLLQVQIMHTMYTFAKQKNEAKLTNCSDQSNDVRKLKKLLKECQVVMTNLKKELIFMNNQVTQKDTIIQKLIQQKQEHILHLSSCQGDSMKTQIQSQLKKIDEMKMVYDKTVEKYQLLGKKQLEQIAKLKNFNKVLRIENNRLRQDMSQFKYIWRKQKKIGTITNSEKITDAQEENLFQFTVNEENSKENSQIKYQVKTPEKLSYNLRDKDNQSTDFKSSRRNNSNEKLYSHKSSSLFQNKILKEQIYSEQPSPISPLEGNTLAVVQGWFHRLKELLDSDQE